MARSPTGDLNLVHRVICTHRLTKASLPVGAEVLIKGYHSRNGQAFGYTVSATTLADGHVYKIGQQQSATDTADAGDKK